MHILCCKHLSALIWAGDLHQLCTWFKFKCRRFGFVDELCELRCRLFPVFAQLCDVSVGSILDFVWRFQRGELCKLCAWNVFWLNGSRDLSNMRRVWNGDVSTKCWFDDLYSLCSWDIFNFNGCHLAFKLHWVCGWEIFFLNVGFFFCSLP